jgi:hypothetical protein
MSGPEPPEVPDADVFHSMCDRRCGPECTTPEVPDFDIDADVDRLAAARIARIRHSNRIRAGHRLARLVGVERRNEATLARIRQRDAERGNDQ